MTVNLYTRTKEQAGKAPTAKLMNMTKLSEDELNAELEKGHVDMTAGRTKPVSQAFADIRRDYGIRRQ